MVEARAAKDPSLHQPALRAAMEKEAMQIRGLDPENAAHKKAFMADLAANDAAIEARGGVEYENGEWWKDESNGGNPHTGSWEASNPHINPNHASGTAGGGAAAGGGGGSSTGAASDTTSSGGDSPLSGSSQAASGSGASGAGQEASQGAEKQGKSGSRPIPGFAKS